ncbi:MAG: hypothetical protein OIF55_15680 [Amphritea sp.]|nr:hypothetical protein [Amphritea sp.]
MLSNTQVTQLGERLRANTAEQGDLARLDDFRQMHSRIDEQAYKIIQDALAIRNDLVITKRKRKTQQSIVDKLRRQKHLRLPQMQDIAGCRIVLQGGAQYAEKIDTILMGAFRQNGWQVESKRRHAYGYRAIHIVAKQDKKFYEVQLRTFAQDVWANLIERASDKQNTLKYGGTAQEQPLIIQLEKLAERFAEIDQQADTMLFIDYQKTIEDAIRHVLSH